MATISKKEVKTFVSYLHCDVYRMGRIRPQTHHSASGAPLPHLCFRADGFLDNRKNRPLCICRRPDPASLSLVYVLSANAVYSVSDSADSYVARQAGTVSFAETDGASFHSYSRAFTVGAD